jgi:hypothetical protein
MNHDFLQDFERELAEERQRRQEEEDQMSGWNVVEIDQTPVDIGVSFFSFFMHYSFTKLSIKRQMTEFYSMSLQNYFP